MEILQFCIRVFGGNLGVRYRGYMNIHARIFGITHIIENNYQTLAKLGSGKLLQSIHSGMESYSYLIYEGIWLLLELLVALGVILYITTTQNWLFLLFFAIGVVCIWAFQRLAFRYLTEARQKDVTLNEAYTKQTAKILMNFILLKIYNLKNQEIEHLRTLAHARVRNYAWMKLWFSGVASGTNLLLIIFFLATIAFFGRRLYQGATDLATILFLVFLFTILRQQLNSIGLMVAEIPEKLTYIQRYDELVLRGQDTANQTKKAQLTPFPVHPDIHFRDITYAYEGQHEPLYDTLSLTIPWGQKVALVGRSGSGKSTLLKLLTRLVEPEKGMIYLGDIPITNIAHEHIYTKIGYFWQEPLVFDGTIAENLSLHTPIPRQTLQTVLKRVKLDHLSLETVIGEHGVLLSGGEKQRLALARAFLFDYDIILLDEPTSNLDEELEKTVLMNIFDHYQGKTIIVVSHRPFILEHVDRTITMRKGEIVDDKLKK